jgi:hypothetical protein
MMNVPAGATATATPARIIAPPKPKEAKKPDAQEAAHDG